MMINSFLKHNNRTRQDFDMWANRFGWWNKGLSTNADEQYKLLAVIVQLFPAEITKEIVHVFHKYCFFSKTYVFFICVHSSLLLRDIFNEPVITVWCWLRKRPVNWQELEEKMRGRMSRRRKRFILTDL